MAAATDSTSGMGPVNLLPPISLAGGGRRSPRQPQDEPEKAATGTGMDAASEPGRTVSQLEDDSVQLSNASVARVGNDLHAIGAALSAGNLPLAQSAYAALEGDLRTLPLQLLAQTDSGIHQTAQRADMLISFLSSVTSAAMQAAEPGTAAVPDSATSPSEADKTGIDLYA